MTMKMTMAEFVGLKPCPFCGSTRAPEVSDVGECEECSGFDDCERRLENHTCEGCDRWERPMFVVCNYNVSGCGASGPYRRTEAEAIAAWNSRAAMEFDNWFYLPKPKEPIVEVAETTHAWDGTKVKTDVFYQVQEQAVINWAKELDEHIIKRICEVWNSRADYHGYKQAAIEAWESIKAWNSRAERTCEFNIKDNMNETEGMGDVWIECSACNCVFDFYADEWLMKMSYCPNCGARKVNK